MAKNDQNNEDSTFEEGAPQSMTADFANVQAVSFENIPAGSYPVAIESCEYETSKAGNPMWKCTLQITEGEHENRKLFTYIAFSEKAMPFAKATLERIAPDLLAAPFQIDEEAHQLVGVACVAKVKIVQYEGEPRNQVEGLYAAGGDAEFA